MDDSEANMYDPEVLKDVDMFIIEMERLKESERQHAIVAVNGNGR